jgi:hypothetical protein
MMTITINIALVFCLSLMLWVGSAEGDLNETGNETDAIDDNITKELFSDSDVCETDDFPPFRGAVGPEHALYKLKIAFGNIGETFTYNNSERLCKQVSAARHRMVEVRAEMDKGNEKAAGLALGHYRNKTDEIDSTLDDSDINATGLMQASRMMMQHRNVLQNMIQHNTSKGKNLKGLMNALNNSYRLEEKINHHIKNKLNNMAGQTHGKGPEVEVSGGSVDEKKGNGNSNGKGNHNN